ncbi:limbic system-associated membrane protein-like [Mercenaria mercenaria]|uniref:limbic system-associated membrane protein-like n=1 Tax=Mercenaria mercenaria TaxID=6596 RepID=UPI00234F29BB|nr:limbic system-associated membrane protein-like [Mercenaria mercenaria]
MILRLGEDSNLWTPLLRLLLRVIMAWLFEWKVFAAEPSFGIPAINVTVIEGDTAVLECSILHLTEEHQVVWTDAEGFLLTHNAKRIIDDKRLSVERPLKQLWNLHIRDVHYSDRGKYVCQISTQPPKHKDVILNVLVPPYIIEQYSSKDMTVQEGDTVTLVCNATGVPQPEISWFRYLSDSMQEKERIGSRGEVLIIHNVSRECGGTYVCEADSGVEPRQTREIKLVVQYPPEVFLPSARLGQHPGRETFLQCEVTAHPHGTMFWEKDGRDLAADRSGKFNVEIFNTDYDQKKILSLRIREIKNEDFGQYTCVADNFVGADQETMILYDYSIHMRRRTTTTASPIIVPPVVTDHWIPVDSNGPIYNQERSNNRNGKHI